MRCVRRSEVCEVREVCGILHELIGRLACRQRLRFVSLCYWRVSEAERRLGRAWTALEVAAGREGVSKILNLLGRAWQRWREERSEQ